MVRRMNMYWGKSKDHMDLIEFNGEHYHDDRMYVLYLCKCTEKIQGDNIATTIYHESAPADAAWCLVTYRNVERYMAVRVDPFESKQAALEYMRGVEPTMPLISLGGSSPVHPLNYDDFVQWKKDNDLKEYDYKSMYLPGTANPMEVMFRQR
jgi:hypothetical protein